MSDDNVNEITFEEASKRLFEIVQSMEKGSISLNKAFDLYKEGITLSKFCSDQLTNVSQEVLILQKENGELMNFFDDYEDNCEDCGDE